MSEPNLKVVSMRESNFRDTVVSLRRIADDIEAGKYGDVGSLGLVLFGDTVEVFGIGPTSETPTIALLLHAGFMRLSMALENYGH